MKARFGGGSDEDGEAPDKRISDAAGFCPDAVFVDGDAGAPDRRISIEDNFRLDVVIVDGEGGAEAPDKRISIADSFRLDVVIVFAEDGAFPGFPGSGADRPDAVSEAINTWEQA